MTTGERLRMRAMAGLVLAGVSLLAGTLDASAAAAPQMEALNSSAVAAQAAEGRAPTDARIERQKALAEQATLLFDMATQLKAEVDKTNKNILSLKVVQKAEAIEGVAKGMKERPRR